MSLPTSLCSSRNGLLAEVHTTTGDAKKGTLGTDGFVVVVVEWLFYSNRTTIDKSADLGDVFVDFSSGKMCICFTSDENCHCSSEKTVRPQNGLFIFLRKETHSETKSWKSSRILRLNPFFKNFVSFSFLSFFHFFQFFIFLHFLSFFSHSFFHFLSFFHFFNFSFFFIFFHFLSFFT